MKRVNDWLKLARVKGVNVAFRLVLACRDTSRFFISSLTCLRQHFLFVPHFTLRLDVAIGLQTQL
jgi:hypothetical protein